MIPFSKFTFHAKHSLREAENIAHSCQAEAIEPQHLLLAIYFQKGSLGSSLLHDLGIGEEAINSLFLSKKPAEESEARPIPLSEASKKIIVSAYSFASKTRSSYVGTEHIAHALMQSEDKDVLTIIRKAQPKKKAHPSTATPKGNMRLFLPDLSALFGPNDGMMSRNPGRQDEEPSDPIEQFCIDLNARATEEDADILIGRDKEIDRLINILGRKSKNNAILVGDPGVGKTAIACGLAKRIEKGTVPPFLLGKTVYELDMALVIAGTTFRGEFEARLKDILHEAKQDSDIILFIDEIHTIIGSGNTSGSLDAANILKPALSRGEIQCIGATTFAEYKKYFEKDAALERRFQPITISEPGVEETKRILTGLKKRFEKFHNASITAEAVQAAVDFGALYVHDRFFPDKALDILDEAASEKRNREKVPSLRVDIRKTQRDLDDAEEMKRALVNEEKYDQAKKVQEDILLIKERLTDLQSKEDAIRKKNVVSVDKDDVARTVSQMTGVPMEKIVSGKLDRIRGLEMRMKTHLIGQDDAIDRISSALERSFAGLGRTNKPMGSFLLLGPTGVGKTFCAQILAKTLHARPDALIRVNMSEFRERHSLSGLIGAPAGYIGHGEGGKFTERVRRNPHSIVLLDEIDKAHPDVLNVLLQILEDGELTDAEGRRVNFANTVIILTSNAGSREIASMNSPFGFDGHSSDEDAGKRFDSARNRILGDLAHSMRPEILSRLDDVIVFPPLKEDSLRKIVSLELKETERKLRERGIAFSYSSEVLRILTEKSVQGREGARSIRKNVQQMVETRIARHIVDSKSAHRLVKLSSKKGSLTVAVS